jgi:hypothetical protein
MKHFNKIEGTGTHHMQVGRVKFAVNLAHLVVHGSTTKYGKFCIAELGRIYKTPSYDTNMLPKIVFDKTAFVKFKISNNFKQNIYETDSKQPNIHRKIHTSLWVFKI